MKLQTVSRDLLRRLLGSYLLNSEVADAALTSKVGEVRARVMASAAARSRVSKNRWKRVVAWRRDGWPRWKRQITFPWVIEMLIIAIGVTFTLVVGASQLASVNDGLASSTAAAVYQQQQEIDDIFVEYPELVPYFDDEEPVSPLPVVGPDRAPAEVKALEDAKQKEARIEAIAFRLLDHFEHIRYHLDEGLFETSHDAWEEYIRASFKNSPVLCRVLTTNLKEYDSTEKGSLWKKFAAEPCAKFGIRV